MTKATLKQQELSLDYNVVLFQGNVKDAMKQAGALSNNVWQVPLGEFTMLENFNTRIKNEGYFARVRAIANSMKVEGFKKDHPLSGFIRRVDGVDTIAGYAGYTRMDAVALANSELDEASQIVRVPFVIADKGKSLEDLTVDLVTGNLGAPLQPFEVAVVCKRLFNGGLTVTEIAQRLHMEEQRINDLLLLISSSLYIRNLVQTDKIAATEMIALLHKHEEKAEDVVRQSEERAHAAGKTRITAKFRPGAIYKKAVQKSAPVLVSALKEIQLDPAFSSISAPIRAKLADLMKVIEAAEASEKEHSSNADLSANAELPLK